MPTSKEIAQALAGEWPPEWPGFRLRMDGSIWTLIEIDEDGAFRFQPELDAVGESWRGSLASRFMCFYDPLTPAAEEMLHAEKRR